MIGKAAKGIMNISNEDECTTNVRNEYPDASGVTWYSDSTCWAEYGGRMIESSVHRTCVFQGFLLVYVLTLKLLMSRSCNTNIVTIYRGQGHNY